MSKSIACIRKGIYSSMLKIALLEKIRKKSSYSYMLSKEINKYAKMLGYKNDIRSSVYNILASLEKAGYVKTKRHIVKGKVRNYYTITKKGAVALGDAKKMLRQTFANAAKDVSKIIAD
ncbi:MAG: PadR family transcriptional regulator [Candidatus Micrarchaeaceae archaeon]